jgi:hypothetical protein
MGPRLARDRRAWARLAGATIVGAAMGPAFGLAWTVSARAFLGPCIWCLIAPCPQWGCPSWRLTMLVPSLLVGAVGGALAAIVAGRDDRRHGVLAMLGGLALWTTAAMVVGTVPDMDARSLGQATTVLARHLFALALPAVVSYGVTRRLRIG